MTVVAILLGGLASLAALVWLAPIVFGFVRGYRVTFQGRAGIVYSDKRGVVFVDGEGLVGPKSYVVYPAKMTIMKARHRSLIDDAWRAEIIDRIERAVGRGKLEVVD